MVACRSESRNTWRGGCGGLWMESQLGCINRGTDSAEKVGVVWKRGLRCEVDPFTCPSKHSYLLNLPILEQSYQHLPFYKPSPTPLYHAQPVTNPPSHTFISIGSNSYPPFLSLVSLLSRSHRSPIPSLSLSLSLSACAPAT
ncbi:hypothetical protein O3P69_007136 [Scylla paramamosain]|uniref:Uncharacterized protein n=1 Tax=Scylla paramamosain TaxID=85552 RepID=A0AAW0V401_SCYPA